MRPGVIREFRPIGKALHQIEWVRLPLLNDKIYHAIEAQLGCVSIAVGDFMTRKFSGSATVIISGMEAALFLDRDGVIIENRASYVRNWAEVEFIPGALRALAEIRASPYRIVLVTNQSVIGRGLISLRQAEQINEQLAETIRAAGGRLDRIYMCPHAPEHGCACRKPEPGLFLAAAGDLNLDLASSIMIGDAVTDLLAARAAGVASLALVLTGRGRAQIDLLKQFHLEKVSIFPDLVAALRNFTRTA